MQLGHEVTVACGTSLDVETVYRYYRLSRYPRFLALGARRNSSFVERLALWGTRGRPALDRLAPDMILLNGALPLTFRAPTCSVSHDLERRLQHLDLARVAYKRLAYSKTNFVVATCTELKAALSRELRIDPAHVHLIPTCVNPSSYTQKPIWEREDAILHMGIADYKNPAGTIQSFSLLKHQSASLYITGTPNETVTSCVAALEPTVRRRIKLLGNVSSETLKELLGRVKVVSVPSVYFVPVASPTVIESFASGTPVVGSPCITKDLLQDGHNGFVRQAHDCEERAVALDTLLEKQDLWRSMANSALATAQRFSAKTVAQSYLELFKHGIPLTRTSDHFLAKPTA